MLELLIWVALGGLIGFVYGVFSCADTNRTALIRNNAMHVGLCAAIAALGTGLLFLLIAFFLERPSSFSPR